MRYGRWSPNWRGLLLFYGCVITLLFCFFSLSRPTLLTLVGLKIYDSMVRALPQIEEKNGPVLIDLDEKSLAEFGQWPWPRYRVAQLMDKLNRLAPRAVGLDILFAEPDRTSLHILQQELEYDLAIRLDLSGLPENMENNDLALARSLERGPFVLGYKFLFDEDAPSAGKQLLHPVVVAARQRGITPVDPDLFTARAVITNIPELSGTASGSGFLNYPADADGVLRRVPVLIRFQDQIYPSMALATAMLAMGQKNIVLDMEDDRLQAVLLDDHRIPVDDAGNLLLAFRDRRDFFDSISAADILHDKVDAARIAGKIILVGTTATGLVDTHPTPLDPHNPGIAIHATVVENIINNHFLARPAWAEGGELGIVLLLGLLSTFILAVARPLFSLLFLICGSAGLWYGSFFLLREQSAFINPLVPGLALFVNFAILSLLKFWREEQEVRKRTRELLLAQHTAILSMTALVETRDNETGGHILRTQHYVRALAEYLACQQKYKKSLDRSTIDMLFRSAPL